MDYGLFTECAAPTRTMPPGMSSPVAIDISPLLEEMKRRRVQSKNGPNEINQPEIAEAMGVSSGQVSRLEGGHRSMWNLTGSQVYQLLLGYHFTPLEIQGIVARYKLNTPPELLSDLAVGAGMVVVMSEGGVTRPSTPVPVSVPEAWLDGRTPSSVTIRTIESTDLATELAKNEATPGTVLVLSTTERPTDGSLVILKANDGLEALALWPVGRVWATPYDSTGMDPPVAVSSASPIVSVVVTSTRRHPTAERGA